MTLLQQYHYLDNRIIKLNKESYIVSAHDFGYESLEWTLEEKV